MKALVGTFNQEKALVASRGLLGDCEIFANLRITFVWSSSTNMKVGGSGGVDPVVPAAGAARWAQGECRVPATTQGPAAAPGPDTG